MTEPRSRQGGPDPSRWCLIPRPVADPRLRLICFAYAGGSADLFRSWVEYLDLDVELVAVRLPGRGMRLRESLYSEWPALVEDCTSVLAPYLGEPHALFGHSFGGRLAYEIAQRARSMVPPGTCRRLFLGGCRSPDSPQVRPYLHDLPESEYRVAVRTMGGTPAEVFENERLMTLMLPALRADMRLAELWGDWHRTPLNVPLHVYYGQADPIDGEASVAGWRSFTTSGCELFGIDGAHFFLDSHRELLLAHMATRLRS
ncbi:thioesterase II family protein [Burkholderia catarinensis]|uniref:thioesterase II family protein n=1 Tax=Burkholderia catarinensis TaxID=1108140 RepID=UPI000B1445C1|nr:alpha/beta fold hydrolase [Burkholderia catarinensis]KAG8149061.1 thioesterase [Burkholderia catarinensis]